MIPQKCGCFTPGNRVLPRSGWNQVLEMELQEYSDVSSAFTS